MKRWLTTSILALLAAPAAAQDYGSEIRALSERRDVRRAFSVIESTRNRFVEELIELTQIPAPPFGEAIRAARFADLLKDAGIPDVTIDEEGNVLARRRGDSKRVVAVVAHLDTVFPEGTDVTVERDGDKLVAPGIGDDTAGLCLVLAVIRALQAAVIATDAELLFVGSVGEEGLGDLRGVKHLFREGGPRIDSFIAVDGGRAERVTHRALGSHRYRVTFRGPGGHSWGAFGLANPAHALGRAVYHFEESAAELVSTGVKTSYNVGRIGGGTSVNSIPFENWMEIDMRSESPERLKQIDALLQEAVALALEESNQERFRKRGEPLSVDVEMIGDRPFGETPIEAPLVGRALAATRFFGVEPELGISSTDSNIPISKGIPAITIGRGGSGSGAHSLDEWWADTEGGVGVKKALLIVLAEAGVR